MRSTKYDKKDFIIKRAVEEHKEYLLSLVRSSDEDARANVDITTSNGVNHLNELIALYRKEALLAPMTAEVSVRVAIHLDAQICVNFAGDTRSGEIYWKIGLSSIRFGYNFIQMTFGGVDVEVYVRPARRRIQRMEEWREVLYGQADVVLFSERLSRAIADCIQNHIGTAYEAR